MNAPVGLSARPVLCLVTDRQRLAASVFSGSDEIESLIRQIGAAVEAGIELIQIRERDLPARSLVAVVSRAVEVARGTASRIIVNDRLDVALGCGAAGVHLRGDSMPAPAARSVAPAGFVVGRSVHTADEAAAAGDEGGLDYLIAGSVYPTASKPGRPVLGVAGLDRIVRGVSLPVLGIGGIGVENVEEVGRTGAAGVAAIGLFAPSRQTPDGDAALRAVVTAARRAFGNN